MHLKQNYISLYKNFFYSKVFSGKIEKVENIHFLENIEIIIMRLIYDLKLLGKNN